MTKLPRTLHIEGSRLKAGQVDPEAVEFAKLAGQFLVVEEKVDGTGVSIFFDDQLDVQVWHRGSQAEGKEFTQLWNWVNSHQNELFELLENRYILFGEWMLHKHTIFYDRLPHYFLESDIYDSKALIWLSTDARHGLLTGHNYIKSVPVLASLKPTKLGQLTNLISKPLYQSEDWRASLWGQCGRTGQELDKVLAETDTSDLAEGLYIKHEEDRQVLGRYKYVRYEFVEHIVNSGSHVRDREPTHNVVLGGYQCLSL